MTDESHVPERHDVRGSQRSAILLAFIEHASRPVAFLLVGLFAVGWLFYAKGPLFDLLGRAERLKIGFFEAQLRERAASADVGRELRALGGLNDHQIDLFLVVGGKERQDIMYNGEEVTEENLRKLQEVGLLAEWGRTPDGRYRWTISKEGNTLHRIVRSLITSSVRRSAA
jgi:hypothetical protein